MESTEPIDIKELISLVIDKLEKCTTEKIQPGLSMGLRSLDWIVGGGLKSGQLMVIAGRPSMGKSVLAMNIAEHIACKSDKTVIVFNTEISSDDISMRTISSRGMVDGFAIYRGSMPQDHDWQRMAHGLQELANASLLLCASPRITAHKICENVKKIKMESDVGLVVIDCLQNILDGNNAEGVSRISRVLKRLAQDLQIPIILTSRLNSDIDMRQDKRPKITDLAHLGDLLDESDVVISLYRHEVYCRDYDDSIEYRGVTEVYIPKNRNGIHRAQLLMFVSEYFRFFDMPDDFFSISLD